MSVCAHVGRNKGDVCRYTGKIKHGKGDRESLALLCCCIKHTVTNGDNFPYSPTIIEEKNLIVICHPLFVKQLLLNSSYVLSSAVKRSSFSFFMVCRMHFSTNTAPCKGHPIRNAFLSSEHNGKTQHLQPILTISLDIS